MPDGTPAATPSTSDTRGAGLLVRLAAALYDALLIVAIVMVTTALFLPLTGGEAITRASAGPLEYLYRLAVAGAVTAYLCLCWVRVGQTLGMKAWRLRLVTAAGDRVMFGRALLRALLIGGLYLLALTTLAAAFVREVPTWAGAVGALPLVASYLWRLVDRAGDTLHDRLSRTRVLRVPRTPRGLSAS